MRGHCLQQLEQLHCHVSASGARSYDWDETMRTTHQFRSSNEGYVATQRDKNYD